MKVCVNTLESERNDGPYIFARRLAFELEKQGVEIVDRNQKHDILLAIIRDFQIEESKRKGAKIVQRLDGIYHYTDQDYKGKNQSIQDTYDSADSIIFQTEFNKKMVPKYLGKKDCLDFIIHNGVDSSVFRESKGSGGEVFLCSSKWRSMKRLESILFGFESLENKNLSLWVLGETQLRSKDNRIKFFGEVSPNNVPNFYGRADFFVHLAYDDNCPNSVVEALVCQLPVVCTSNGGTPELVRDSGEIVLEEVYDMTPYKSEDTPNLNIGGVRNALERVLEKKGTYNFPREDLYIGNCAKKYIQAFQSTLDN